jgi:hypothetical protein
MRKPIASLLALLTFTSGAASAEDAEHPYKFTLPESWRDVSEPDLVAYESANGQQQLVVAEYKLKKTLSQQELRSTFKQYVELRRQAELEFSKGSATIGEPVYSAEANVIKTEYWGSRDSKRIHFATIGYATSKRFVTFRFESIDGLSALQETVGRVTKTVEVR